MIGNHVEQVAKPKAHFLEVQMMLRTKGFWAMYDDGTILFDHKIPFLGANQSPPTHLDPTRQDSSPETALPDPSLSPSMLVVYPEQVVVGVDVVLPDRSSLITPMSPSKYLAVHAMPPRTC